MAAVRRCITFGEAASLKRGYARRAVNLPRLVALLASCSVQSAKRPSAGINSASPVHRQRNEVEIETKQRDKRELWFPRDASRSPMEEIPPSGHA